MLESFAYERRSHASDKDPSGRSPTERDRDRILYSEEFRRLGGVTQVAPGAPSMLLHNRLTHSIKVEQVGVALAKKLNRSSPTGNIVDVDAVAAGCLAHDIGHAPFGHLGETTLNELVVCDEHRKNVRPLETRRSDPCRSHSNRAGTTVCELEDGFEGNAQSFRILTALSEHRSHTRDNQLSVGLNLTRLSIRATSKYPWARGDNPSYPNKWGAYDIDVPTLEWLQNDPSQIKSLEAEIMDWADDIAYAVHDIEDFYRVGRIPLEDYLDPRGSRIKAFLGYCAASPIGEVSIAAQNAFVGFATLAAPRRFEGEAKDYIALDRIRSVLITWFINAAHVVDGSLIVDSKIRELNSVIKQLTWYHIIHNPELAHIQYGQESIIKNIFNCLKPRIQSAYRTENSTDQLDKRRIPMRLRNYVNTALQQTSHYTHNEVLIRSLLDYISSLSDFEAYELNARLAGVERFEHL